MRKVALVGAGVSKFGGRRASYRDLIWEAGKACFDSVPGVKPRDLEGLVVGSVMPERTAFQSHIASMAAEALGIRPTALSARTEHMCASGTVGIRYAYAFIAAGLADLVMVLGVEKLNQPTGDEAILNMGTGVDREWEAAFGLTAPPGFALAAQLAARGLRALAGDEARGGLCVQGRRRRCAGRGRGGGSRLLLHRRADRLRGARLLRQGRGGALRRCGPQRLRRRRRREPARR